MIKAGAAGSFRCDHRPRSLEKSKIGRDDALLDFFALNDVLNASIIIKTRAAAIINYRRSFLLCSFELSMRRKQSASLIRYIWAMSTN